MIERLAQDGYKSEYFWELYNKTNKIFIYKVLKLNDLLLNNKELIDILRFADIFSNSKDENLRNLAYKIISLLFNSYSENEIFNTYLNAVLKKLNNFPALKNAIDTELPLERELEFLTNKEILKSPIDKEKNFLPNQFKIYQYLKSEKSLAFSGPTSMGKSFVIKQFLLDTILNSKKNQNFCIIVPTRALIKQYVSELNTELKRLNVINYKILTNSNILEFVDVSSDNFIFVLTQERLNVLLYSEYNIKLNYLIIDEAYKIYDENIRGLTFYSAVDTCLDKYKNIKVLFASPLIENPEIFKKTFNSSINCNINTFKSNESPVGQNLFYINLGDKTIEQINEINQKHNIKIENYESERNKFYYDIGSNDNNIVYLSGQDRAINYSLEFVTYLKENNIELLNKDEKEKLEELCILIEKIIHKDFFLIQVLKHGVAYHYGKLPNIIRESVESLFKEGIIKYMFCTSTLLEGVNLPVKNIFIMANFIGRKAMQPLEFWNLAGRAGRLGYEFYGNIFCVNDSNHNKAWKKKDVLYSKNSIKIEDKLEKKINKDKKRLIETLSSKEPTIDLKNSDKYTNYLANIIQIDKVSQNNSIIIETVNKIQSEILDEINIPDINLDYNWINSNKTIDYKIQESLFNKNEISLACSLDYSGCLEMLKYMYEYYKWEIKENGLKGRNKLEYIALLMNKWINGWPLNEIIQSSIDYYSKMHKEIWISIEKSEKFTKENPVHINVLINNIVSDVEQLLRFDLEKYFNHYYNLLKLKYGETYCGYNISLYLEFGTRNTHEIILQNVGFSRYTSHILQKYYSKYIYFEENSFLGINELISTTNIVDNIIVYNEIKNTSYFINKLKK